MPAARRLMESVGVGFPGGSDFGDVGKKRG